MSKTLLQKRGLVYNLKTKRKQRMTEKPIIDIHVKIKNRAKDLQEFIKSMGIYANEEIIINASISGEKEAYLTMLREIKDELKFLQNISNQEESNDD